MTKRIILPTIILLFTLLLLFTACPQAYYVIPNAPSIYVQENGITITTGKVFGDYGHSEAELAELRNDKPCFEVSWKNQNEEELNYHISERVFTDTLSVDSIDYATFYFSTNFDYWDIYNEETKLKLTYYPQDGEPKVIDNIPTNWFDDVITGKNTYFVADFGTLEFTERHR